MWIFIKVEWKHWLKSPMTWIFFGIVTLLVAGAVSSDYVTIGENFASLHKNAPFVIQSYYGAFSLIALLMTAAFMNASATRDFSSGMDQIVFSSPIRKRDYYFGKFIGAATISLIPLLGVSLGSLIGPLLPWVQHGRYGGVIWQGHFQGLLTFGIPNTLIAGAFIFVLAILYRSNIVSFTGAILLLVFYIITSSFTADIQKEWLANILDPFGFNPERIISKYMTVDEKNLHAVPLAGALLVNRMLWMGIGIAALVGGYFRFSFASRNEKVKNVKRVKSVRSVKSVKRVKSVRSVRKGYEAGGAGGFSWRMLRHLIGFETAAIIKSPVFIIITVLGLLNTLAGLSFKSGNFGVVWYPVTFNVIESMRGSLPIFIIAVITFYSGVLVWKERDAKLDEIKDSSPVKSGLIFTSRLVAMIVTIAIILLLGILIGMVIQVINGYYRFEIGVYLKSMLVIDLLSYSWLIIMAMLIHYLLNNRFIAYFAFIVFYILNQFIWSGLQISSFMLKFGTTPGYIYSDMNGFGPFSGSLTWFSIYWTLASSVIALLAYSWYVRGRETGLKKRWQNSISTIGRNRYAVLGLMCVFLICAGFVFYNTKIINTYQSPKELEHRAIDYEKTYKKYEHAAQPRFYKVDFNIDLMPYIRSFTAGVDAWTRNISDSTINELYFTIPGLSDSIRISINGATLKMRDDRLHFRIYSLDKPMLPGDSLLIRFDISRISRGFENNVSFRELTSNGTFFTNTSIMPLIGYDWQQELSDISLRKKYNLPKRLRGPVLDENNLVARSNSYVISDADWVEVSTVISTEPDQIAIAPGSLVKSWESNGRKYFNYRLEQKSLDFFSFISARYEVAQKNWNGIDLEVYYIKEHAVNVPNMLRSLEKSLEYFTANFGPYYHKQCRIVEFPRYGAYAQSFPTTMPYSEDIGFIMDLRKVTLEDIDEVFYVVAHETAHQYWAHQVCGARMQGSEMLSESFAQYSALMVMEKEYGREKMKKFLEYEMNGYLRGRSREQEAERPLARTEDQGYIHYQKGSVIMYYLKEMIGEDKVNNALHKLTDSFAYKNPPYPTSLSALRAFREVTPDSLQYLIGDLFENITLFSNRVTEANYTKSGDGYEVTFKTESEKFYADTLGTQASIPVNDYIDIGVFAKSESKNLGKALIYQRLKIDKTENTFTFHTKEIPYEVGIDPYNYLIDRLSEDNLRKAGEK
jgi:ABC-type transport system involved in multi-copper enzyme maturation permease subunit